MRIASASHVVFAAIMIAIGMVGLVKGEFTPVWDPIPQNSHALAYDKTAACAACFAGVIACV